MIDLEERQKSGFWISNIRPYSPSAIRKLVSNISSNPAELFVSRNHGCSLRQMGRAYVTRPKQVWEMQQSHWNLQKFLCPSRMASELSGVAWMLASALFQMAPIMRRGRTNTFTNGPFFALPIHICPTCPSFPTLLLVQLTTPW